MYRNPSDRNGVCQRQSNHAEEAFRQALCSMGIPFKEATFAEQMEHIDFFLFDNHISVDVKSTKRLNRSGTVQHQYVWVEFTSNRGRKGWLYGKADWISFEGRDCFVVVPRARLLEYCLQQVDTSKVVTKSKNAIYKIYQRKNQECELSLIPINDLLVSIPCFKLKKHTHIKHEKNSID